MTRRIVITYKNGKTAEFINGDPLELDLDGQHSLDIFSVQVFVDDMLVMSAYHWHNAVAVCPYCDAPMDADKPCAYCR